MPLAYPPLLYLLARMIWVGFRGAGEGLRPSRPTAWLAIGGAFLLGFRIALNIADSGRHRRRLRRRDRRRPDRPRRSRSGARRFPSDNASATPTARSTTTPTSPSSSCCPWSGTWDNLPAAHAAAIAFDLATVGGLFVVGTRLRPGPAGTRLGVVLAFAWAAYPFTDYALQSNSNDALVAALLVWALVVFASPVKRGALLGLSIATKFAPLPLVPLFAAGDRGLLTRGAGSKADCSAACRPAAIFCLASPSSSALMLALPAIDPGLGTFYDRTVKSQLDRTSPFSVWGQDHSLEWLQTAFKVFAVALAVGVAFLPRRRSLPQVAALAAAVMIAVEITAEHWFYLYIPWFFGLLLVGLTAATRASSSPTVTASSVASAPGVSREKVAASAR